MTNGTTPTLVEWRSKLVPLVAAGLLPGLHDEDQLDRFAAAIEQSLVDHDAIRSGSNLPKATRGSDPKFEPFAAIKRLAVTDWHEGVWLAALATAIGWDRPESIGRVYHATYGREQWTWGRVSGDGGAAMAGWIGRNADALHKVAKFGDHRRYQSHRESSATGTGRVVRSLVTWLRANPDELHSKTADFERLYHVLEPVVGFGRTARYDFARLMGLLGLAPLEPKRCYFEGSSGPQRGARRFFGMPEAPFEKLEARAREVEVALGLTPMLIEDILCQASKT